MHFKISMQIAIEAEQIGKLLIKLLMRFLNFFLPDQLQDLQSLLGQEKRGLLVVNDF